MAHHESSQIMINRHHSRIKILVAGLLMIMLLFPTEHVFGAICKFAMHSATDKITDTCCPESGDSERESDAGHSSAAKETSNSGHCDPDSTTSSASPASSAHLSCVNCDCSFVPASEKSSSHDDGITKHNTNTDFFVDNSAPLFTISIVTFRETEKLSLPPSLIPIFLRNQVFRN